MSADEREVKTRCDRLPFGGRAGGLGSYGSPGLQAEGGATVAEEATGGRQVRKVMPAMGSTGSEASERRPSLPRPS